MPTTLTLTYEDRLAVLTLNRPEKRNALCHALMDEFDAALQEVAASRAQVLLLAAEGKAFSAGMDLEDLKALAGHTAEENHRHSERIAHLFRSLYLFPKVTIAAVQGAAIAAFVRATRSSPPTAAALCRICSGKWIRIRKERTHGLPSRPRSATGNGVSQLAMHKGNHRHLPL